MILFKQEILSLIFIVAVFMFKTHWFTWFSVIIFMFYILFNSRPFASWIQIIFHISIMFSKLVKGIAPSHFYTYSLVPTPSFKKNVISPPPPPDSYLWLHVIHLPFLSPVPNFICIIEDRMGLSSHWKTLHWFGIINSYLKAIPYIKIFGTQK